MMVDGNLIENHRVPRTCLWGANGPQLNLAARQRHFQAMRKWPRVAFPGPPEPGSSSVTIDSSLWKNKLPLCLATFPAID